MNQTPLRKTDDILDVSVLANRLQFEATTPDETVWVGASAGSGKTKVLAERVLRLMLPNDTSAGADPARILCITFTKAAAAEVMERIMRYLRDWTIVPDAELNERLGKILGKAPDAAQIKRARELFARVLEVPGGMKIMTIHAFCQSVLARFPMEAGLPAGFKVMDDTEAKALMTGVRHALIMQLQNPAAAGSSLHAAFDYLASLKSADDIEKLMATMAAERARLAALRARYADIEGLCAAVEKTLSVAANTTSESAIEAFLKHTPDAALRGILPALQNCKKAKGNQTAFNTLDRFLSSDAATRHDMLDDYIELFATKNGNPKKPAGSLKDDPAAITLYADESARALSLQSTLRNIETARATNALLRFTVAALDGYEAEKRRRNRLDYEDLIDRTRALLNGDGVHWVQYKLDGGIDHILVDEAQDTNPDQWDIVTALSDEFYAGLSARGDVPRTTFVVGDEKQSIFSFQRADPRVFDAMRARLEKHADKFRDVPMRISFRSSPSILRAVDAIFAMPDMASGVARGGEPIIHQAFHSGKAGHVELWPLIERQDADEPAAWHIAEAAANTVSPVVQIADKLADTIKHLLDDPSEKLESQNRRIEAGDIMILVAKRKPMADAILKALRARNIPVGGIDRMVVTKQLAVMDVLAALVFTLQPDDDLNLASLLKSPLVGLDEDALYTLCIARGDTTLWNRLKDAPAYQNIAAWLGQLLEVAGSAQASSLLHHILYRPCVTDSHTGLRALMARLGPDVRDPLQELLARADTYDRSDTRGLQGFLQDALDDDSEIKRQMNDAGNRVRLMTVHGSKGLEAPIVFMPDTVRASASANKTDPILWPDRADTNGVPLWAPNSDMRADICDARVADARVRADEEYKRLLYVALTRAGERLYIGGAQKSESRYMDKNNSWYFRIANAFTEENLGQVDVQDDGTRIIKNAQTAPIKMPDSKAYAEAAEMPLPTWAFTPAPVPENPPRPLMPSKPSGVEDDPAAISPLFGDIGHRFKRGRIIHTMFQFLPELPADIRTERATAWLAQPAHDLSASEQAEILAAVMNVLNDPAFGPLFGPDARAEVPLTGLIEGGRIVSGQMDRLVVTATQIMVLDYKTNRPAPKTPDAVPEAYKAQLRTYRDLLRRIWPEKQVSCALLWTDGPRLMDITEIL